MNPVYFTIGGLVIYVFIFRRELLVQPDTYRIILAISISLFLAGLLLQFIKTDRDFMSGALLCPLICLGLFRLCRRVFLQRFKHEPRDTFLDWQTGLTEDRLFNILYFAVAGILWMIVPFIVNTLKKAI